MRTHLLDLFSLFDEALIIFPFFLNYFLIIAFNHILHDYQGQSEVDEYNLLRKQFWSFTMLLFKLYSR